MTLPCDIVMDLISLYHDRLASRDSVEAIEAHLRTCPDCRRNYRKYQMDDAPVEKQSAAYTPLPPEEDYQAQYKALSQKIQRRRLFTTLGVAAYVCASAGYVLARYIWKPKDEENPDK